MAVDDLETKVFECSKDTRINISLHSLKSNHPVADTVCFIIIDRNGNCIVRENREAIYIRKVNPVLNKTAGKVHIPKVFGELLGIKCKCPVS